MVGDGSGNQDGNLDSRWLDLGGNIRNNRLQLIPRRRDGREVLIRAVKKLTAAVKYVTVGTPFSRFFIKKDYDRRE